jgi:hypothetical protein
MSTEIHLFSENDIRSWVGPASFQRGRAYFLQGAIQNPRRQGTTLKASCLGSYTPSYRVEVTFGSDGIGWADCSCPVGGGYCKHVAAMLQREPDLEILLELPIPAEDTDQSPIDPDTLREQVAYAFRGYGGDWGWLDLTEVAGDLDTFLDLAESYLRLEKAIDAATIYQVVSETILPQEEFVMGDEAGVLG